MAEELKPVEIVEVKDEQGEFEKLKKELLEAPEASSEELNIETLVRNLSKGRVKLIEMHFWNGRTVTGYHELPVNYQAHTLQRGTLPQGVKFGLVYTDGADAEDTTARKFVVAVDSPARKIYADAGPTGPVDWNGVEVQLATAKDKVEYVDPIFGGKVVGEMIGVNAIASFYN